MSVNTSSSSNGSLIHPNIPSINYNLPLDLYCLMSGQGSIVFIVFFITITFLILPLCILIIHHGLQQWRQKNSTSLAETMSHSDCFTYHTITMEMVGFFGCILCFYGMYNDHFNMMLAGLLMLTFTWFGEIFFHVLTCVERYLAVVHPITYLSLRKERGIRIRNISIGCVWLLSLGVMSLLMIENVFIIVDLCLLISSLTVVSFCSLSVLRVLIRPGPGEQGGGKERVDQSKQRAFYTIMAILGVLVLRFSSNLSWAVVYVSGQHTDCVMRTAGIWLNLPSILVLPLLFVLRARKLVCCQNNIQQA